MIYLLLFILCAFPCYCQNASYAYENGRWIHYQRQAPQNDIMSIYALPDGKIWVDTYQNPYHIFHIFDGQKWQKITCDSDKIGKKAPFISDTKGRFYFVNERNNLVVWEYGLPNDSINEYTSGELTFPLTGAFSSDNTLYIGSYNYSAKGGIYKFDGENITKIKDGQTRSLTVDPSERLWVTHKDSLNANMRLIVLENENDWTDHTDEIVSISVSKDLTVQTSRDGSIWVNNLGKYGIYKDGKWTFNPSSSGVTPMFLYFDSSGGVWGYGNNYIYRLGEDSKWYQSRETETIINNQYFIAGASDLVIWTFDSENIYRYSGNDEEPWVLVKSNLDLASDTVTCIAYTDEGKLVCGHGVRGVEFENSEKAGISILTDSTWYNYRGHDGLSFRNVYDLLELDTGDILVYADYKYSIFNGYTWEKVDSLYTRDDDIERYENDMIQDEMGTVWIATTHGFLEHDFIGFPNVFYPLVSISPYVSFYNLFMDSYGTFYMQNLDGNIISYNRYAQDQKWKKLFSRDLYLRDFVVDMEDDRVIFWGIRQDNLFKSYEDYTWQVITSEDTGEAVYLKDANFIHIDEEGKIWASGYDNTGYLENGVWHRIPELAGFASSAYARSEKEKIALNAIKVIKYDDNPFDEYYYDNINYYGVFEYSPDQQSTVSEEKQNPFSVSANYPNPFNSYTTISFQLPHRENVNISVYNILGQHVKTLADHIFPAGNNNVVWDSKSDSGTSMSSGIYFYRIKTKNAERTGKMLLLR